jgi:Undecaprenyl-phosphate glucose phosphotransferase
VKVTGAVLDLEDIINENDYDEIVITLSLDEYEKFEDIVNICEKSGVHTKFVPDYNNMVSTVPYIEDLYGLPVINIRNVPLTNTSNLFIKRAMDIIIGSIALIISLIPMLIIGIIIKCTSKGPALFSQIRVGKHGKEFKMFKFRSMYLEDPEKEKEEWTTRGDKRVTPIGRFIRKTSLDELPQLFNVLGGSMSLVGPRPERPQFVEKFKEEVPRYMIKHQVRPGMTGWAQINGLRGDTSIRKRIEYDLYYIENWSVGLDIKILFLTIFKGFINKNAY